MWAIWQGRTLPFQLFILGSTLAQFNPTAWQKMNSDLAQVSYDGVQICGARADTSIWCGDFAEGSSSPEIHWRQVEGGLSQAVVHGDSLFGVFNGEVYAGNSRGNPSWTKIPGGFNRVAYDGKVLCGLTPTGAISCADSNLKSNPTWYQMPTNAKFKDVTVGGGQLYAISEQGSIFYKGNTDSYAQWTQVGGGLDQISFDGATSLCGTLTNGDIYCANQNLNSNPNWSQINKGSAIRQVVVHGNQLVGAINNQVYTLNLGTGNTGSGSSGPVVGNPPDPCGGRTCDWRKSDLISCCNGAYCKRTSADAGVCTRTCWTEGTGCKRGDGLSCCEQMPCVDNGDEYKCFRPPSGPTCEAEGSGCGISKFAKQCCSGSSCKGIADNGATGKCLKGDCHRLGEQCTPSDTTTPCCAFANCESYKGSLPVCRPQQPKCGRRWAKIPGCRLGDPSNGFACCSGRCKFIGNQQNVAYNDKNYECDCASINHPCISDDDCCNSQCGPDYLCAT